MLEWEKKNKKKIVGGTTDGFVQQQTPHPMETEKEGKRGAVVHDTVPTRVFKTQRLQPCPKTDCSAKHPFHPLHPVHITW